jgi:hypothetical protein
MYHYIKLFTTNDAHFSKPHYPTELQNIVLSCTSKAPTKEVGTVGIPVLVMKYVSLKQLAVTITNTRRK